MAENLEKEVIFDAENLESQQPEQQVDVAEKQTNKQMVDVAEQQESGGKQQTIKLQEQAEKPSVNNRPNKTLVPAAGDMAKTYCGHFGKIFSNLSIFLLVLSGLSMVSVLLPLAYYAIAFVIMIAVIVFTLGFIFLEKPDFIQNLFVGQDIFLKIVEISHVVLPYTIVASLATALVSIILLALDKTQNHSGRIITSSIMLGLAAAFVVIVFAGVLVK